MAADLIASRSLQGQSSWDHVIDAARVEEEGKAEEEEKGAGDTRRHDVRGGERKKFSQRNVPRKASKVTLYREIVERIRCPDGSPNDTKKAPINWYSSFGFLAQKWTLAILAPREKATQRKHKVVFCQKVEKV